MYRLDAVCLCANQEPRRVIVGALSLLVCDRCKCAVSKLRKAVAT